LHDSPAHPFSEAVSALSLDRPNKLRPPASRSQLPYTQQTEDDEIELP